MRENASFPVVWSSGDSLSPTNLLSPSPKAHSSLSALSWCVPIILRRGKNHPEIRLDEAAVIDPVGLMRLIGAAGKIGNEQHQICTRANSAACFRETPKGSLGELCRFASPAEGAAPAPGGGSELPQASVPDGSSVSAKGKKMLLTGVKTQCAEQGVVAGCRCFPRRCPSRAAGVLPGARAAP